jgi:hypothetical protein
VRGAGVAMDGGIETKNDRQFGFFVGKDKDIF